MWIITSAAWVYRLLEMAGPWVTVTTLLVALPLLVLRKTRVAGAYLLIGSFWFCVARLWVESFLYLAGNSAWGWIIVGVLTGLFGVIPSALVHNVVHLNWANCGWILANLLWMAVLAALAYRCLLAASKSAYRAATPGGKGVK